MDFLREAFRGGNRFVLKIATVAAIGGFLFGYDTGVISGALLYIKKDLGAGSFEQEAIVSSLLIGAVLGAILSGYTSDKVGRRPTKIGSGTVYVIGAVGSAFAPNVTLLVVARCVLGLSVGTASFVSPEYISEQAPKHPWRRDELQPAHDRLGDPLRLHRQLRAGRRVALDAGTRGDPRGGAGHRDDLHALLAALAG